MDTTVITPDGLDRLQRELERLTTEGRREIAERLRQATQDAANFGEDPHYADAREEQALLERRIAVLEERLAAAQVVEPREDGRIDVGERVRVRDLDSGERLEFELVGPFEADPANGRISIASPVGKAIAGLGRGQTVEVEAPGGTRRFEVLAVELAPARAA
jgi:transcription elongation factor GreA